MHIGSRSLLTTIIFKFLILSQLHAGSISGTVTDFNGNPVRVRLQAVEINSFLTLDVTSGSDGSYQIPDVPPGAYVIFVLAQGDLASEFYDDTANQDEAARLTIVGSEEVSGIDFVLDQAGSISGIITRETDGIPIAGIFVHVVHSESNDRSLPLVTGVSDSNGFYQVNNLKPGPSSLLVNTLDTGYGRQQGPNFTTVFDPFAGQIFNIVAGEIISNLDFSLMKFTPSSVLDITWHQTNGPIGGNVWSFMVNSKDPNIILAGIDHGGIRRTLDGGQTWETITSNRGLDRVVVFSVVANPENSDIIYAGTRGAPPGVFKTIDGGDSWFASAEGIAPEVARVLNLSISKANPNVLYAGTLTGGIFKTEDSADKWNAINNDFPTPLPQIYRIAINPQDENVAYSALGRLYKTTNGGNNWGQVSGGGLPDGKVVDVDVDASDGNIVYAIVNEKSGEPRATVVFKSQDGGNTWSRSVAGIDSLVFGDGTSFHQIDHIETSKTRTGIVYAISTLGIFRSLDFAENWQPVVKNRPDFGIPNGMEEDPSDSNVIYYGPEFNTALLKVDIAARSVKSISKSLVGLTSGDVLIDPANPNIVYSGMGWEINGAGLPLQKSIDGGQTWFSLSHRIEDHVIPPHGVVTMVIDPTNANTIYVGTNDGGIFKTEDGGETFQFANVGLTSFGISTLAINEDQPNILYAGTSQTISLDRGDIFTNKTVTSDGIFKSENGGDTWQPINNGLESLDIAEVVIDPSDSQTIYSCVYGDGIYKSTNAGESWQKFDLGVDSPVYVFTLSVSPSDPEVIYAAENDVPIGTLPVSRPLLFFRTTDGGQTWQAFDFYGSIEVIWVDPQNSSSILVGSHGQGVFYSTDGAETFTLANNGLIGPEHMYVFDILTNPTKDLYYVGGCGRGVYKGAFDPGDIIAPELSIADGIDGGAFDNDTSVNLRGSAESNLYVYTREPQSGRVVFARSDQQGHFSFPSLAYREDLNEMTFSATDSGGNTSNLSISFTVTPTTSIEDNTELEIPADFAISNNYPNPFNPATIIKYQLPKSTKVTLKIYNISGQLVRTLSDETKMAGYYEAPWDGKNNSGQRVSSGIYLYQIVAENFRDAKKMVLLR